MVRGGGVGEGFGTPPIPGREEDIPGLQSGDPGGQAQGGRVWSGSQDFSSPSASFVTACVLGCQLHPSMGLLGSGALMYGKAF